MIPEIVAFLETHAFLLGLFLFTAIVGGKVDQTVFSVERAQAAGRRGRWHYSREFQVVMWFVAFMVISAVAPDPEGRGWNVYQSIGMYTLIWGAAVASYTILGLFRKRFGVPFRTYGDTWRPGPKL